MNEVENILDGQRDVPEGDSITTKEELNQRTSEADPDADEYESLTSTESGRALFKEAWIAENTAKAMRMVGIGTDQSDRILNGGNSGHYSGKAMALSDNLLEGDVLNSNKDDMGEVLQDPETVERISAVGSIPLGALKIGEMMSERFGDRFSPERAFLAGDKLNDGIRDMLRASGYNELYEGWGTAEMGIIATEVKGIDHPNRVLMPLLDQYTVEIYPVEAGLEKRDDESDENYGEILREGPESEDELVDIKDVDSRTVGRAYPSREGLSRYDQRDAIRVYPSDELPPEWPDDIPGIKVLGRLDGITVGGPTITEEDMENIIQSVAPEGSNPEYHFSKVGTADSPGLLIESDIERDVSMEELYEAFERYVPEVNHARENGFIDSVIYERTPTPDLMRGEGAKIQRFSDQTAP